jgi:hypothetical protein
MIYEKIQQTIGRFNHDKGFDILITPIRVDKTVKANTFTIPDEIQRVIGDSALLIADLSSKNINVYQEVGYAMGAAKAKGKEPCVVLLYKTNTCFKQENEDTDKFVGFNMRDTSQLRFEKYEELEDGLYERLSAFFEI